MRPFIAFFLAPLAVVLPAVVSRQWGPVGFVSLFVAYPLAFFVGMPCYLYFRRRGWLRLWQVMSAAAAIGALFTVLVALWDVLPELLSGDSSARYAGDSARAFLLVVLVGAVPGAVVGLAFWLIAYFPHSKTLHANGARAVTERHD